MAENKWVTAVPTLLDRTYFIILLHYITVFWGPPAVYLELSIAVSDGSHSFWTPQSYSKNQMIWIPIGARKTYGLGFQKSGEKTK